MARASSLFICQQCGYQSSSYLGKCPECGTWGSLVETLQESTDPKKKHKSSNSKIGTVVNLRDVEKRDYTRINTKIGELDRVLGGGIVKGAVVLVAGDPGIGKSTLLSQLAVNITSTLYVAGEESPQQIKLRIDRIRKDSDLAILNEVDVDVITSTIEQRKPELVIVDSIQTLETQDLQSAPGSVGQVRECAHRLQRVAKQLQVPIFIVGHVTKEGTVAGPKTLEHLVDVVLQLEGDETTNFRILRGIKNRFGPTDEVGIFIMEEYGLAEVNNPSQLFLEKKVNAPGSAVIATINGVRAILVEVQALVTKSNLPIPRRIATGIDNNKLQLLVAVLTKRLGLSLFDQDIFVNVTGGMKIVEPAIDLGVCMAIISSFRDKPLGSGIAFMGEVGLLGELRSIRQIEKRENEAKKLGFTTIISPVKYSSLEEVTRKSF